MSTSTLNGQACDELRAQLLDAARDYLERGLKVLPISGKNPNYLKWQLSTLDFDEIQRKLDRPDPAIGVQMGPTSGIIDFEWDSDEQQRKFYSLFPDGVPPVGPRFTSKHGGHALFAWDDRLHATRASTVDLKCEGGKPLKVRIGAAGLGAQSAFPPSPNKRWEPELSLDDCNPPKLPDTVIQTLIDASPATKQPKPKPSEGGVNWRVVADMLTRTNSPSFEQENDGSKRLYTCCCVAVEHDLSEADAIAAVRAYEPTRPFPKDYSDDVIAANFRRAETKVVKNSGRERPRAEPCMTEQLQIACGPKGRDGKRLVICTLGAQSHRHRVDADDDLQRRKWRERIVGVFSLPEDAHYSLETDLIAAADGEDERERTGWEPMIVCMSQVEADKPTWLWDSRILAGGLNELMGDAGLGKSTITIDIAARLSRGDCMPPHNAPDGTFAKQSTLFITSEDALQFVLKPRLLAAGADPSCVHALSGVAMPGTDEQRQIQLLKDLHVIERTIESRSVGLVVIDPYSGFIDDGLNINSDPDNRKILGPLAQMAERTNTSVLLIRHLNKKEGQASQYRGGGSVAITAACRSSLLIAEDPDDAGQRVLATNKCNLAKHPQSLCLSIEDADDASLVRWGDACDLSAGDLLKTGKPGGGGKIDKAKEIIESILACGPRGSNEVEQACTDQGVSKSTFHRARKDLGVVSEKTDFDGQWLMTLPSRNGAASHGL